MSDAAHLKLEHDDSDTRPLFAEPLPTLLLKVRCWGSLETPLTYTNLGMHLPDI